MPAEPVPLIGSVSVLSVRNASAEPIGDLVEHDEEVGSRCPSTGRWNASMTSGYGFDGPGPSNNRSACCTPPIVLACLTALIGHPVTPERCAECLYAARATQNYAESAAKRSELAGAASGREAGIPPNSERDPELRREPGEARQTMPAPAEAAQRVVHARLFRRDQAARELRGGARDAGDVVVGKVDAVALGSALHRCRDCKRSRGRVVQQMRATQRVLDAKHRACGGDLVGDQALRVGEIAGDQTNLVDLQPRQRVSEINEVHLMYLGSRTAQ